MPLKVIANAGPIISGSSVNWVGTHSEPSNKIELFDDGMLDDTGVVWIPITVWLDEFPERSPPAVKLGGIVCQLAFVPSEINNIS